MTMTTQAQIRAAFWNDNPDCERLDTVAEYVVSAGATRRRTARQNDYPTDTRCAFVDYVDALQKSGEISEALAARVTL